MGGWGEATLDRDGETVGSSYDFFGIDEIMLILTVKDSTVIDRKCQAREQGFLNNLQGELLSEIPVDIG